MRLFAKLREWFSAPDDSDDCPMIFNGVDMSHMNSLSPEEQAAEMKRIKEFDPYDPFKGWPEEEVEAFFQRALSRPPVDISKFGRVPMPEGADPAAADR